MSEYLIQGETLTSIANEIRELSGTTAAMGLDDMTSNLDEANTEVASQSELIVDIIAALEGKAAGGGEDISAETAEYTAQLDELEATIDGLPNAGGGGGSGAVETCTVTVNWSKSENANTLYQSTGIPSVAYINSEGELTTITGAMGFPMKDSWTATIECMCGTILVFTQGAISTRGLSYTTSEEIIASVALPMGNNSLTDVVCILPNTVGNYTIDVYYN